MKKILCLLLTALFLAGCKTRYDVTLNNGLKLTGVTKPVLNPQTGVYTFTDGFGRSVQVKESRVRLIEPHEETQGSQFTTSSDAMKFNGTRLK